MASSITLLASIFRDAIHMPSEETYIEAEWLTYIKVLVGRHALILLIGTNRGPPLAIIDAHILADVVPPSFASCR